MSHGPPSSLQVQSLHDSQSAAYFLLACFVFGVYDNLVSFPQEIEWMCSGALNKSKVLLLWNRVVFLTSFAARVIIRAQSEPSFNACKSVLLFTLLANIAIHAIANAIISLRVYALYNKSNVVKIILSCGFVVHVVGSTIIAAVNWGGLKQGHKIQPGTPGGCSFIPFKTFWTAFNMDLVFDALVFVLTVYKAWHLRDGSFTPLVNHLMRAGIGYFAVMTFVLVLSTAVAFYPIGAGFLGSGVTLAITSVLCSRMLLSLHHQVLSTQDMVVPMGELSLIIDQETPTRPYESATTTLTYFMSTNARSLGGSLA